MQIVYYSLNGTTEKAARQLAGQLDLPLYRIEDATPRKGLFGFLRSGFEASTRKCARIRPIDEYQPDAEHVVLLCPVWAGSLSSPMRTFCTQYAGRFASFSLVLLHADPQKQFEEIRDEIALILGAENRVFGSFCNKSVRPDDIRQLAERLDQTVKQ